MRHADAALRAMEGVAAGGNRTSVKDAGQSEVYRFDGTETVAKDAATGAVLAQPSGNLVTLSDPLNNRQTLIYRRRN
jgi:hypothetical protein